MGAAERGKAKDKAPPAREATPSPQVDVSFSEEENQLTTDPVERSPQKGTQTGDDTPPRKRKKAQPLNLTREQEVSVIEWPVRIRNELIGMLNDEIQTNKN